VTDGGVADLGNRSVGRTELSDFDSWCWRDDCCNSARFRRSRRFLTDGKATRSLQNWMPSVWLAAQMLRPLRNRNGAHRPSTLLARCPVQPTNGA
jgi:hypothetical protein